MSGTSSSPGDWWSLLEPAPAEVFHRRGDPEDPRLGDVVTRWMGGPAELMPGQPVLIGFSCDEGVRRNGGRPGAALAPRAIRQQLYRLTAWEPPGRVVSHGYDLRQLNLIDLGDVRVASDLETAQARLGQVVAGVLLSGGVPVVIGGGHETAYGHYLGYVGARLPCAIVNVDAHLDVRAYPNGGHSGSPFRQAMEHPTQPLLRGAYAVIGAQRHTVAQAHWRSVLDFGGRIYRHEDADSRTDIKRAFAAELDRLTGQRPALFLTVDADAFRQADVPGVSAPNPTGLDGSLWPEFACHAGATACVRSIELVEVNPLFDRDEQTTRRAAVGLRQFLVGLAPRPA